MTRAGWGALLCLCAAWLSPQASLGAEPLPEPPRIGLVLSGGGARGLAHVGVLKVLERERIPVHAIGGTSMGAIIGGLYASGMSATEMEAELRAVNWDAVFANRIDRPQLSQRRKEEDFTISPLLEFGMRAGELRMPLGAVSGRGLESLLRRYTLPARGVASFDALPIPFRAVATDMVSSEAVVFRDGDLAHALRSSMSVPGVFAPSEANGRLLGDGGLINNLPVDVVRAMGVDVLIVVNIGTPLAARDTLSSVGGLTTQMINILTEQNVQRSLASLGPRDVLISPQLGALSSTDFNRTADFLALGEQGAQALAPRLAPLALSESGYAAWRAQLKRTPAPPKALSFVRFRGSASTHPERFAAQLESQVGQVFDAARAERDTRRIAASGDYLRTDYTQFSTPEGDGLVFDLEEKPWGPHYFHVGLDMATDFSGRSAFNLKLSHNRRWLSASGSEWRNQLQVGNSPRLFTELYHPLHWSLGPAYDWFVAGYGETQRRSVAVYNGSTGHERGHFKRTSGRVGFDLGQRWGELGELRIGLKHLLLRSEPEILSADYLGPRDTYTTNESGLRAGLVIDQLDYAHFPQRGYRFESEIVTGQRRDSLSAGSEAERFTHVEAQGNVVASWRSETLNAYARFLHADQRSLTGQGRYTLGGFQQMSGYQPGQIEGNYLLFGRLAYYHRLPYAPVLTRGFFAGGTLEAGNAWAYSSELKLHDLRSGGSLFVGADTGLGPLHLALTYAPRGSWGFYLVLGRP